MTAREVLTLNEDVPQIVVPQSGDTYVFPRAAHFNAAITTDSTVDGRDIAADGDKLDLIEDNATADQSDSEIATAYQSEVPLISQGDAEAGVATGIESWSALRVAQAIAALGSSGTGDLLADGTVPLTANWDVGAFQIRAETFQSDVTTGTAPLTVASTTVVTNLNADLLDGNHATAFATSAQGTAADGALPKAGGEMSGNITMAGAQTVDGRDLSVDGAKLDLIEAQADVTDSANVEAAGALMDSEVTNLSQVKAFSSADYATAAQGVFAVSEIFSGYIETVAEQDYVLWQDAPFAGTINTLRTESESGTCTFTGKVGSTALGGAANSASTTAQEQSHVTSNTFAKGDIVKATASANSACLGLSFAFYITRTS